MRKSCQEEHYTECWARETPMVLKEGSGMKVAGDAIEMLTMLMS
jgi:hypothetical protein